MDRFRSVDDKPLNDPHLGFPPFGSRERPVSFFGNLARRIDEEAR